MNLFKYITLLAIICFSESAIAAQDTKGFTFKTCRVFNKCASHWHYVMALDRSGSMNWGKPKSRWHELISLVNN